MSVFTGRTGYIVWPQGETGVHTCRVYESLDEAAFDSWVRIVARYYDAEEAIRQFCKEKKS